jgi:ADP-ribose pyrophosphatase
MSAQEEQSRPHRVEVLEKERVFDSFFQMDRARLRFEQFDGTLSEPVTRLVFERGDSVGVLLYDGETREVVLAQQFRYPAYTRDPEDAWLWEIVAGMQEGDAPEEVAHNEAMEEAGYRLDELHYIMTLYPSPGGSSERMHLYLAPVTSGDRVADGGGVDDDAEDVRVARFELGQALEMVRDGRIRDAKTVVALQYLALYEDQL